MHQILISHLKFFLDTRKCVNNNNRFCCVKNTLNILGNEAYVK